MAQPCQPQRNQFGDKGKEQCGDGHLGALGATKSAPVLPVQACALQSEGRLGIQFTAHGLPGSGAQVVIRPVAENPSVHALFTLPSTGAGLPESR